MSDILTPSISARQQNKQALIANLCRTIWGLHRPPPEKDAQFYLAYYEDCIGLMPQLSSASHQDVVDLVEFVKHHRFETLGGIKQRLKISGPKRFIGESDQSYNKIIEFGASLWLMIGLEGWQENKNLNEFVSTLFPKATQRNPRLRNLNNEGFSIKARDLDRIGDIELIFTSRLEKHMFYEKEASTLYIFRHASFLGSRQDMRHCDVFPKGLLQETAETIDTLFPPKDTGHWRWRRRIHRKAEVDLEVGLVPDRCRDLDYYNFWHERLQIAQGALDRAKPRTLKQWVYDWRDMNQSSTFWLAIVAIILGLLFGLVQCITGLIAVIKS